MKIREALTDYSKGDNLNFFWRLYGLRERASSRMAKDILSFFLSRMAHRHGGYVGRDTVFLGRPSLPHGLHGIYLSRYASIGRDCRIYQNVTVGEIDGRAPRIGDDCLIGAGAVLVGDIAIGSHVKIGAGSVVNFSVPDHCTVVAQPSRVIERGDSDDGYEKSLD